MEKMIWILDFMERDLSARLTQLPELCRQAGRKAGGILGRIFLDFARELDWNAAPDASGCMVEAIGKNRDLPEIPRKHLLNLGDCLGKYDLELQLEALHTIRASCEAEISEMKNGMDIRTRNYRTIGFCFGAVFVIFLL